MCDQRSKLYFCIWSTNRIFHSMRTLTTKGTKPPKKRSKTSIIQIPIEIVEQIFEYLQAIEIKAIWKGLFFKNREYYGKFPWKHLLRNVEFTTTNAILSRMEGQNFDYVTRLALTI